MNKWSRPSLPLQIFSNRFLNPTEQSEACLREINSTGRCHRQIWSLMEYPKYYKSLNLDKSSLFWEVMVLGLKLKIGLLPNSCSIAWGLPDASFLLAIKVALKVDSTNVLALGFWPPVSGLREQVKTSLKGFINLDILSLFVEVGICIYCSPVCRDSNKEKMRSTSYCNHILDVNNDILA